MSWSDTAQAVLNYTDKVVRSTPTLAPTVATVHVERLMKLVNNGKGPKAKKATRAEDTPAVQNRRAFCTENKSIPRDKKKPRVNEKLLSCG